MEADAGEDEHEEADRLEEGGGGGQEAEEGARDEAEGVHLAQRAQQAEEAEREHRAHGRAW